MKNIKKALALLLLAALLLLTVSCGKNADVPDGMQLASGDDVAYLLYVPGGWNLTTADKVNGAYYSQTDKSSITVNSYYPDSDTVSVEDYLKKCEASYANVYDDYAPEGEPSEVVFGGQNACKTVFTATVDRTAYKFMQVIAVHGNMFYVLTYTSTAENYDLHTDDVDSVISNFVFR